MNDIILDLEHVNHQYGNFRVLHDINLKIARGQFVALVGPSGCGKSTFLKAVQGVLPVTSGLIKVNGRVVHGPNRDVGVVPQHYGLYKFLTAQENVALGLKLDETDTWSRLNKWKWWQLRRKHMNQAAEILTNIGLGGALKLYPDDLSGGMKQRTAFARMLIMKPKLMILDEPFGAQDEHTREELQKDLLTLYQENLSAKEAGLPPPNTLVIITHELTEALYVSDRVIGFSKNWYLGDQDGEVFGSTKVLDQRSPVYHPSDPKDFSLFEDQRKLIAKCVLGKNSKVNLRKNPCISFAANVTN
jgi:NitT/TauT family transport system ATP-binding protein